MECSTYSDELQHWGIKGQRWGQRRFQNKDGSLTPAGQKRYNKEMEKLKKETAKVRAEEKAAVTRQKTQAKFDKLDAKKQDLEARKEALKNGKVLKEESKKAEETVEQKRDRLLKSVDPKELYESKELLSTIELNERINRIDTEARMRSKIVEEHAKTGMERMDDIRNKVDKAVSLYRSVDSAYSTVTNSSIGKVLAKKLGLEPPKKEFDFDEFWKNRHTKTAAEMSEAVKWKNSENILKSFKKNEDSEKVVKQARQEAEKEAKAAQKRQEEAQKQVDDYNKRWRKGESDDSVKTTSYDPNGPYRMKGKDITDAKTDTRVVKDYPAVVGSTSISNASSVAGYSRAQDYVRNSNATATRLSDADVEIIPPEWYTRYRQNN